MDNIWSFLNQTLTLSVTAVLILLLKKLFEDKLSPRWQYGIWSIFVLRLLLPVGLFHRYLFPRGQVLLAWIKNIVEGTSHSALSAPYEAIAVTAPFPIFPDYLPFLGSITDWLFYFYAYGVVISLLWLAGTYCILRHTVSKGRKAGTVEMAQAQAVAEAYSLPLPRRIVVLPQVESAFVCGLLRPVLVLPERVVDDKVILHELLHLRYGDVWAGVGISLMRCLHWCNPLVWYCCGRMRNDCEALCDQRVLERLEGEARREYGVILLSMADGKYASAPGTSSMANGAGNIKRRIAAIARFKRYPAGMALVSVCVALVLGTTCLAGSSEALPVPDGEQRGTWALTQAILQRPTTVAGALDTYAKAMLCDNPVYYAMVLPETKRSEALLEAQVPYEYYAQVQSIDDSPFAPLLTTGQALPGRLNGRCLIFCRTERAATPGPCSFFLCQETIPMGYWPRRWQYVLRERTGPCPPAIIRRFTQENRRKPTGCRPATELLLLSTGDRRENLRWLCPIRWLSL